MGKFVLGRIEIDEDCRRLTAEGADVAVQPLVFDFLTYLLRHRDRAVTKSELLDNLWPGVTVSEASLQRVASIARGILRQGGAEDALISVPRFGYRLQIDEAGEARGASKATARTDDVAAGRDACAAKRWAEAVDLYGRADAAAGLGPEDLEQWALALECVGCPAGAIEPLSRAVAAHSVAGNRRSAANPAITLSKIHLERGELAVAKGWHSRAAELIAGDRETREYGLWCWMGARLAATESEPEKALALAIEASQLGKNIDDPVVTSLGLIYRGFYELCLGETEKGVDDQNVAAALGLSSDIDPVVGGILYCNILWACRNFGDWTRANQWSISYDRWCRSCGLDGLTGSCRLHRAEVLGVQGTLAEAEALVRAAIEQLKADAPWAIGDALRVLGDIHLAAGDLDAAEAAYQKAHAVGWNPQPGFALLQLERGEAAAANQGLERSLLGRGWPTLQRKGVILATLAKVAALTQRDERAAEIITELETLPRRWPMPSIRALTAEAKAAMMNSRGNIAEAARELQAACDLWMEVGSAINSADTRASLARLLLEQGDLASAELELKTVEAIADRLESRKLAKRCREIRRTLAEARSDTAA